MGLREEFQKRIEKKQIEIQDLELKIKEANAYLQALLDTQKLLPKDTISGGSVQSLRPGTAVAKARDAIKKAGNPLHISEILKALGKPQDKQNKVSLSGSLAGYVRKGEVFTRPSPNTFGLIEFGNGTGKEPTDEGVGYPDELPPTFGKV